MLGKKGLTKACFEKIALKKRGWWWWWELLKSEIQVNSRPLQSYTVCEVLLSGWVSSAWPRVSPPS